MKIDHVNVVAADLERSAAFYEAVFGLKRGFTARLEGDWIETVTGLPGARANCLFLEAESGARLELIEYLAPDGEKFAPNGLPNTRGLRHLAFEVENIEALMVRLQKIGVKPISAPVEVPFRVANLGRKRLFYFHDPDGTLLEVAAYDKENP